MAAERKDEAPGDFMSSPALSSMSEKEKSAYRLRRKLAPYGEAVAGRRERLDEYIAIFGKQNIFDPRLAVYDIHATCEDNGAVVLSGEVSDFRYKSGIADILKSLGFEVTDNLIEVLPEKSIQKSGCYRHLLSGKGTLPLRREPRVNSEQMNSIVQGGWVRVLRAAKDKDIKVSVPSLSADGWLMVQSEEGYVGFVRAEALSQPMKQPETADGFLLETASDGETTVSAGSFLCKTDDSWRVAGDKNNCKLVGQPKVVDLTVKETRENIMDKMSPLLGKPYVWGARDANGIDCSGLCQWYARTRGVSLPRDAAEQSVVGRIVAFGSEGADVACPGDLVFFADEIGRISHVGISLGNNELMHSTTSKGGVVIQKLTTTKNGEKEKTLASRIVFVRRLK